MNTFLQTNLANFFHLISKVLWVPMVIVVLKENFGSNSWNTQDFLNKSSPFQPLKSDSSSNSYKGNKSGGSSVKIQCQICKKIGHLANKCFQLTDFIKNNGFKGPTTFLANNVHSTYPSTII